MVTVWSDTSLFFYRKSFMRDLVRHLPTITLLFAYAMATFGGSALHSLVHDCSSPDSHVETTVRPQGHGTCGCDHVHDDQRQDEVPDQPQPKDHDEHSCLICHYLAQAQTEATTTVFLAMAEPLSDAPHKTQSQITRWIPQSYDSRGPPAV